MDPDVEIQVQRLDAIALELPGGCVALSVHALQRRRSAVMLYRGATGEGSPPGSFVSATFSRAVAEEHFEAGPNATLWRHEIPIERLFMTFLETEAMNQRFKEAEAVLLG